MGQDQLSQNKVERLYRNGTELINHSNYGAARMVFSEFLLLAPPTDSRRGEAEYYVAFSALSLGHRDGEKLIDIFIENNPSSPKASTAYYDLANFFYAEANYIKAASYFRKVNFPALTSDQQSQGHFKFGYSYFSQKKLDDALEQFNFVKRQSNAYSPASNYYAGFIEYSNGNFDEALFDLKKAETSPVYANVVPYLIANIYYKQGRFDTLLEYSDTLRDRPDITNAKEIAMLVGEAQYFKGDYKKALESYDKYLANAAKAESGLLFRAGYANYVAGNQAKGIEYLDKAAAAKDTVSYYASYYLGILYLKQGNKPYALNAFNYARKNPTDKKLAEESSFQFAKVSYDAGRPDLAIDEFERFLSANPSSVHSVEVKELLAQAYVNGNNYNKAIEHIEALPSRNQTINQAYQKAAYLKDQSFLIRTNTKAPCSTLTSHWNFQSIRITWRWLISGVGKPIPLESIMKTPSQIILRCWQRKVPQAGSYRSNPAMGWAMRTSIKRYTVKHWLISVNLFRRALRTLPIMWMD